MQVKEEENNLQKEVKHWLKERPKQILMIFVCGFRHLPDDDQVF